MSDLYPTYDEYVIPDQCRRAADVAAAAVEETRRGVLEEREHRSAPADLIEALLAAAIAEEDDYESTEGRPEHPEDWYISVPLAALVADRFYEDAGRILSDEEVDAEVGA